MSYTHVIFVDVPPGTTPPPGAQALSSVNMDHIQDGISTVESTAVAANATAGSISALLGQPSGYASLDASGRVPPGQLPTGAGASLITPLGALNGR